jgi:hypothetical protein
MNGKGVCEDFVIKGNLDHTPLQGVNEE